MGSQILCKLSDNVCVKYELNEINGRWHIYLLAAKIEICKCNFNAKRKLTKKNTKSNQIVQILLSTVEIRSWIMV